MCCTETDTRRPHASSRAFGDAGRGSGRADWVPGPQSQGTLGTLREGFGGGDGGQSVTVPEVLWTGAVPFRSFDADNKSQL